MLDAIVLGLGVMGGAALHRMALAGLRVRGLDRFDVPNAMGSSHGGTRVTRKAYYEDPRYVPLLHRSWDLFRELERERGETLLVQTGGLYFGEPGSLGLEGVERTVREHALAHERLDAAAIRRRFPMFAPADDDVGIFEEAAGALLAERCVAAQIELAIAAGAEARARERATAIEIGAAGVRVTTDRGVHEAERLVLATGAWTKDGLVELELPLIVERQVQLWLAPRDRALFTIERMPVFMRFGADGAFYGLPPLALPGVKVCRHHGGEHTRADALDRSLRPADEDDVRAFVRRHVPLADGALLGARVCMYTSTPDEHFVVGVHPVHPRVLVMAGFSGHGFKLAPALGEAIAELATRGASTHDLSLFDPSRFSARSAP